MSFIGWEDFQLEALSEVIGFMLYVSHRLMYEPTSGEWGVSCSVDNRDDIVLLGNKKKSKPGLYFYLTTNCMEGNTRAPLFFLNVSVLCWRQLKFMNMSLSKALEWKYLKLVFISFQDYVCIDNVYISVHLSAYPSLCTIFDLQSGFNNNVLCMWQIQIFSTFSTNLLLSLLINVLFKMSENSE